MTTRNQGAGGRIPPDGRQPAAPGVGAQSLDPSALHGLSYRFIGPDGNRIISVLGEPGNPLVTQGVAVLDGAPPDTGNRHLTGVGLVQAADHAGGQGTAFRHTQASRGDRGLRSFMPQGLQ